MTIPPLPDKQQIENLYNQWGMLPNIRAHSRRVCNVALTLWQWLDAAGYHLNKQLIETGALLHDIAKTYCLDKPDLPHNLEGQRILEKLGYHELAELVAKHVNLPDNNELDEAAIVFYADKRVVGDKVVSVDERYEYIMKVYGQGKLHRIRFIQRDAKLTYKVEKGIFSLLSGRKPQDLCTLNT